MTVDEMWTYLEGNGIATEEELHLVSNGWGFNEETMETVLYVRTGEREFEEDEEA